MSVKVSADDSPDGVTESAGFDAFFVEHHASIVQALSLALGDDQLARDAAAEGFVRALTRWSRVERYENAPGWVYRVGLNWGRSRWRRTRREVSDPAGDHAERSIHDAEPADLRLMPALLGLSVDQRSVIVARYYLDWSEREIAAALGIRPGTVKSRLSRGLARLSADLGSP